MSFSFRVKFPQSPCNGKYADGREQQTARAAGGWRRRAGVVTVAISGRGQRGVALVVALVLLLLVTLVGIAAVRGTIMQQKMSGNFYDRQVAFQATEAALRQGEAAVQAATGAAPAGFRDCSPPVANHCLADPFADTSPSPAITITTVGSTAYNAGKAVAGQPQYVVEYMGNFLIPSPNVKQLSNCSGYAPCGSTHYADFYRITARSGDPATAQNRASVTLQSTYKRS
ncbi:MAG: PilX N-terminal domain-containing pilus assembly protein [Herbaspirillum sp.]